MTSKPPINLLKWFSLLSLICIGLVSIVTSILLSRFLTFNMLQRDAQVSLEFLQNAAQIQNAIPFFRDERPASKDVEEFFHQIALIPDVLRANVYSLDRKLVWSSDPELIGQRFPDANEELDEALQGELKIETGVTGKEKYPKAEHVFLGRGSTVDFVENYFPIRDPKTSQVVAVAELYRIPRALFETIHAGQRLIWIDSIIGALFLYLSLFWIVRRADLTMRQQQRRLVESETLAAVGEMAGAVAHGIRNPLASIRSSAELMQVDSGESVHESARDIVNEVDRLESWVRDLLTYSQPDQGALEQLQLEPLIAESLSTYKKEMERRSVRLSTDFREPLPSVKADSALLVQVFNSLFSNALEAMPNGGDLTVSGRLNKAGHSVELAVHDTGVGIPTDQIDKVFVPFYTTKRKGLGVGLPLVKRVIERMGGSIGIASEVGKGTAVTIKLPLEG